VWFLSRILINSHSKTKLIKEIESKRIQSNNYRREYFRVPVNDSAWFCLQFGKRTSSWGKCKIIDISAGGVRIETHLRLPEPNPNIKVKLQFEIECRYVLEASIIWVKARHDTYHYGLKWYNLSDLDREKLHQELIRLQLKKRKLIKK
jgi:c-di-GMP-binding flagellar brake protein YcgR